jgi:hypothetical protein
VRKVISLFGRCSKCRSGPEPFQFSQVPWWPTTSERLLLSVPCVVYSYVQIAVFTVSVAAGFDRLSPAETPWRLLNTVRASRMSSQPAARPLSAQDSTIQTRTNIYALSGIRTNNTRSWRSTPTAQNVPSLCPVRGFTERMIKCMQNFNRKLCEVRYSGWHLIWLRAVGFDVSAQLRLLASHAYLVFSRPSGRISRLAIRTTKTQGKLITQSHFLPRNNVINLIVLQ